jgi:hypothetical protein
MSESNKIFIKNLIINIITDTIILTTISDSFFNNNNSIFYGLTTIYLIKKYI